jgi:hypothetical protein
LRKYLIVALAALASIALASVAIAQTSTDPEVNVTNTPSKAGTKKKPKNIKFKLTVKNNRDDATVNRITVFVDKNVKLSGKGIKHCSATQINTQGQASCPKGSKAGSGVAHAAAGPGHLRNTLTVDAYVGGNKSIVFYVQLGTIRKALDGKISNASGKYGQKIVIPVADDLQQPAPGVFSALLDLETTISAKKGKHYLVSTTGCKKKKQNFGVKLDFAPNATFPATGSVNGTGTAKCKK